MDDTGLPYFDEEAALPYTEDFGGGYVLAPEPMQFSLYDSQPELTPGEVKLLEFLSRQNTPTGERQPEPRQPRAKRIITSSASVGTIDPLTGKYHPIEDSPFYQPISLNTMRSPQDQHMLKEMFPNLQWGWNRYGQLVPYERAQDRLATTFENLYSAYAK